MLTATSSTSFGDSRLRTVVALDRGVRAHLVWREQLVVDTRFLARADKGRDAATVLLGLEGWMQVGDAAPTRSPQAWVLAASEFDTFVPGSTPLRSWGDPCITIEMGIPSPEIVGPIGLATGPRTLQPATWKALEQLVEAALDEQPTEQFFLALFARLADDQVISPAIAERMTGQEPAHLSRLWRGLRGLYQRNATSATIGELSSATGLSARQLRRDLIDLAKHYHLPGNGFRETLRILRLRSAVLLLSSPFATVSEVADRVGYGTADALARAFRDAKLPTPSEVQARARRLPDPAP
jgi:AraC-like DNA-binding protein